MAQAPFSDWSKEEIIKAWRDEIYREAKEARRRAPPTSPAGPAVPADLDLTAGEAALGSYSCTKSWGGGCTCSCGKDALTAETPSSSD